jgi:hypothetical protein
MSQGGLRPTTLALKNYNAGEDDCSTVEVTDPAEFVFPMPAPGFPVNGRIQASLTANGKQLSRQYFFLNLRGPDTTISFDSNWRVYMIEVMRIWWKMPRNTAADGAHFSGPIPATPVQRPLDDTLSLNVEETSFKSTADGSVNLEKNIYLHYPGGHIPFSDPATDIAKTGYYHGNLLTFPLNYNNPAPFQADQTTAPLAVNAANNFVDVHNVTRFQRYFSPAIGMKTWRFRLLDINGNVYTGGVIGPGPPPLGPAFYDPMWYGGNPIIPTPPAGEDQYFPVIIRVEMAAYCTD